MDPYGNGDRVRFPHRQFDDVAIDRVFGHTFTGLPPCIVGATLEIRLFAGGSSLVSNDALHLERTGINDASTAWGQGLTTLFNLETGAPQWSAGSDHTFILDLANLPPDGDGQANTSIIPFMNADHALDVYVQDDTGVDYMILTVEALCSVTIDIKPGSDPNSINLKSKGVIPVAILSDGSFDATTVDPSTVCFGDAEAPSQRDCTEAHGTGHIQDVDGDGDMDLVLHYETQQTGIDLGDTRACLTGQTFSGQHIEGCDAIKTVG